jgi:hypothetical protein
VKRSHSGPTSASSGRAPLAINGCQSPWSERADIEVLTAVTSSSAILFRGDFADPI